VFLTIAAASLFGASDECHQSFTPGRQADVFDWLADTLGACLAVAGAADGSPQGSAHGLWTWLALGLPGTGQAMVASAAVLLMASACGRTGLGELSRGMGGAPTAAGGTRGTSNGGTAGAPDAEVGGNACDYAGPSCAAGLTCSAGDSCCTSLLVPGGSYNRGGSSAYPAIVSSFCLDKYEITVGRFRAFLADYDRWISVAGGSHPQAGEGAYLGPPIVGTGWNPGWTLPASRAEFQDGNHLTFCVPYLTWRASAGTADQ